MKQALLIAGAAAFAFAGPAIAKPGQGQGHGQGHGNPHAGNVKVVNNGVHGNKDGGAACPPGLAKKAIPCVPPGQAKQMYRVGQRFPLGYGAPWTYNQIPYDLRTQYGFNPNFRYYYGDGYLYRVDPATMLIRQAVVSALLR